MIQALLHNKLKDSFSDPHFKPSEDSLTSSVIGLLLYLPDDVFWQLLRGSCGIQSTLPESIGEILSVNFWEKMEADGKHNSNYVEPDVWIECQDYDIIIEAKKYDSCGQYEDQWAKEIVSFNRTFKDYDKQLIFIALGGNSSLQDCFMEVNGKPHIIYTSSWYNLLYEVDKYQQYLQTDNLSKETKGYMRLLSDTISIFAKHGYLSINWLESMTHISIDKNNSKKVSSLWEFDNKTLLQNFYKSAKTITMNNIFEVWKIN